MPISKKSKQMFSASLVKRREATSTSVLLRCDFLSISHTKIPLKAGLMKRQEKTHHILGSLRSASLTLKYYRQTCPIASREEANPSPAFPRQTFRAPEQHGTDLFFLPPRGNTAGLNIHGRNTVCLLLQLVHIFTEDKLNNLRLLSGDKSIGSRCFGKQHKS